MRSDAPPPQGRPDEPALSPALARALLARPTDIVRLINELTLDVTDEHTLIDLMGRISREAVRLIVDVDWAGVTAQFAGPPFTAAHTDDRVLVVDEGQYGQGDGPCLAAARTNRSVAMNIDQVRSQWPILADAADVAGVQGFLARPLHAHDHSVGSLNMYTARADGVRIPEPDVLTVLVEYLERGLDQYSQSHPEQTLALRIKQALAVRHLIDHAVGVMMELHSVDQARAVAMLDNEASRRRVPRAVIAAEMIAHHTADPVGRIDPGRSDG